MRIKGSAIAKWLVVFICLILFLLLALHLNKVAPLDHAVTQFVAQHFRSPAATVFFKGATALASPLVLMLICFAAFLWMPQKEYRIPLLLTLGLAMLLNLGLKDLLARVRPPSETALVLETGYSFPSGHTMLATCFYGYLIFILRQSRFSPWLKNVITTILGMIILLVGTSRIYLGVHFLSDVIGACLLSVALLLVQVSITNLYLGHPGETRELDKLTRRFPLLQSFRHAFDGLAAGMRNERNMLIHLSLTLMVIIFGATLRISRMEWIVCIILFGLVIMAELFNTAIETIVNMVSPEYSEAAKTAKDTAAGAVLVIAIAAAIAGFIIFTPKLLVVIRSGLLHSLS